MFLPFDFYSFTKNSLMKCSVFIIALMLSYSGFSQTTLKPQKVLSGGVEILVPTSFSLLPDDVIAKKYPRENRPTVVYGNPSATLNLVINHSQDGITPAELPDAFAGFSGYFDEVYPGIKWYTKEMQDINGKKFIVLEFQTPAADTEIYNLMFMTEYQSRLLIFSFNCTKPEQEEWQEIATKIRKSVKFL